MANGKGKNHNYKITFGQELPKEVWQGCAKRFSHNAELMANVLRKVNEDGMGEQDAQDFLTDCQLAVQALTYVAEFATDKCRIIAIPDKK